MSTNLFESRIINLLTTNFPGIREMRYDSSLFRSGLFDSMSLLIAFGIIEEAYSVKILDDDFDIKKFDTVRDIAIFIKNTQQGT